MSKTTTALDNSLVTAETNHTQETTPSGENRFSHINEQMLLPGLESYFKNIQAARDHQAINDEPKPVEEIIATSTSEQAMEVVDLEKIEVERHHVSIIPSRIITIGEMPSPTLEEQGPAVIPVENIPVVLAAPIEPATNATAINTLESVKDVSQGVLEATPPPVVEIVDMNEVKQQTTAEKELFDPADEGRDSFFGDFREEKRKIKDYLDVLNLREEDAHEREEYNLKKKKNSIISRLGSALLNSSVAVATAIPKAVEAFLPDKYSVVSKIEDYKKLRELKSIDKTAARASLRRELISIDDSYEAISQYFNAEYGNQIDRLDPDNRQEVDAFIYNCRHNPNSIHYQSVRNILDAKISDRTDKYNQEIEFINNDPSYEETRKEMLESSSILKAYEKAESVFKSKNKVEPMPWLKEKVYLPITKNELSYNMNQKAKVVAVNKPEEKESNKVGWFLAAAAAAGMAFLGYAGFKGKQKNTQAEASSSNVPVASAEPTTSAVAKNAPVASNNTASLPLTDSGAAKKEAAPWTIKPADEGKSTPNVKKGAAKAKSSTIPKKEIDTKKVEVKDENVPLTLEETEKFARGMELKLAAFKRRSTLLFSDIKVPDAYNKNGSLDFEYKEPSKEALNGALDQLGSRLKEARLKGKMYQSDLDNISSAEKEVERQLNVIETERNKQIVPHYVAHADINIGMAKSQLEVIKKLVGARPHKFEIAHKVHKDGGKEVTQDYTVDLDNIEANINKISKDLNNQKISEQQAKMDYLDAAYWTNYLKFVDWQIRYNVSAIRDVGTSS